MAFERKITKPIWAVNEKGTLNDFGGKLLRPPNVCVVVRLFLGFCEKSETRVGVVWEKIVFPPCPNEYLRTIFHANNI